MSRGIRRERQVRIEMENNDYVVIRAAGSFGPADLLGLRVDRRPRAVEVKSTIGPYDHFGPADRADMLAWCERAGASAWLAWWPKGGRLRWIPSSEWPRARVAA